MKDKNNWRKKIYLQIEPRQYSGQISLYNIVLTAVIAAGTLPLVVRETWPWFRAIEIIAAFAFSADYILRWVTADYKLAQPGREPFRRYPFMILSVIDLAAAISYLLLAFVPALAQHRWLMILRVSGVLKLLRYLSSKTLARNVLVRQKKQLMAVVYIALEYIFVTALIVFNAEPETFNDFFAAIYWATVSLTTVGYGDIYPVSAIGQVITMVSSFFGIAIIAMPAGIITAGIMQELSEKKT